MAQQQLYILRCCFLPLVGCEEAKEPTRNTSLVGHKDYFHHGREWPLMWLAQKWMRNEALYDTHSWWGFFSPSGWGSAKFPSVHWGISTASSCTSLHFTAVGVSWWDCCPNRKPPNGFVHEVQSRLCSHAYNVLLNVPEARGSQCYLEELLLYTQGSQ